MDLSPGQEKALTSIQAWWKQERGDSQVFRMFGPAGTGKTTIARLIPDALGLGSWNFGAFSGKAAQVLRSKNCVPSSTLHSLIYGAPINLVAERQKEQEGLEALEKALDTARSGDGVVRFLGEELTFLSAIVRADTFRDEIGRLTSQIRRDGALFWPPLLESGIAGTDLLIADEVSMVNEKMAADILATGVRVLVLGDPEQLPPVGGEGYFIKATPDVMLHEIHRQALDSPVLSLATRIRLGGYMAADEYISGRGLDYTTFDQVLCWRRKTRWGAIAHIREQMGRPAGEPVPGDVVMNLANNKDLGVFNGQTFVVEGVSKGRDDGERLFLLRDPGSDLAVSMYGYVYAFTAEGERQAEAQRLGWRGDTALLTFAQALTVHKAQGSEWPNVCVVDETRAMWAMECKMRGPAAADDMARRWKYTAITRASKSVSVVRGKE